MNVTVLSSGSKGNCIFIEEDGTTILIDAGISAKQIKNNLMKLGFSLNDLDAVFITHEHSDHISGLPILSKNIKCPVYISDDSLNACNGMANLNADFRSIRTGQNISIGKICVTPFLQPHDAAMTFGFRIEDKRHVTGYSADLGSITPLVEEGLRNSSILMVEFNHDVDMLMNGSYPVDIKMRIRGNRGHLSNNQGAQLIERVFNPEVKAIFLLHLSENNNLPSYAEKACESALSKLLTANYNSTAKAEKFKKRTIVTNQGKPSPTISSSSSALLPGFERISSIRQADSEE